MKALCGPQVRSSETTSLLTCLLEGPSGAGKTALAATLGLESLFPFVKVISPTQPHCPAIGSLFHASSLESPRKDGFHSVDVSQVISSDNMVGYSEAAKCQHIAKVFDDAYRVSDPWFSSQAAQAHSLLPGHECGISSAIARCACMSQQLLD